MTDEVTEDSLSNYDENPEKHIPDVDSRLPKFKIKKTPTPIFTLSSESKRKMNDVKSIANILIQSRESRVMRFLNKVNNFFTDMLVKSSLPKTEAKLIGRIHQFQKDIDRTINRLCVLREELEKDDQSLFPFLITFVIDPLIKEINRLEKAGEQKITAAEQVKESKEYVDWIEKAKKWIDLCAKRHTHGDAINQAFIDHTFCEFRARIDKDLQVIQDYLNVFMSKLDGNDLVKIELQDQLEQELSQHIFELYLLKDHPPSNSLETLNGWRAEAELARESYFSAALHVIDTNIGELMQPSTIDDGFDQYINDIHIQLTSLEEKIVKFNAEISSFQNDANEEKMKTCLAYLAKMEDEAHSLNGNLELNHEQVARVQQAMDALSLFREQLQGF